MKVARLTNIFFLGALLATQGIASGVGKPLNTSESGIEGQVSIGPICPVERPDRLCPDKPFAASIEIQNQDDTDHNLTIRSGEDGRFRVELAPGKYKLMPLAPNPGAPPHAPGPQTVTVESGKYAHVTIKYDSGIRCAGFRQLFDLRPLALFADGFRGRRRQERKEKVERRFA